MEKHQDPWLAEQSTVWGDGPEWEAAMLRLKAEDERLDAVALAAKANKDPDQLIAAVLDTIAPPGADGAYERVRARFEGKRAEVRADLMRAIEFGAVRHALTHTVANAALRGIVHSEGLECG